MKNTNNTTHNIDKLPLEVVGMIYLLFKGDIEGFDDAYMAEIKLDNPVKHIEDCDDGFIIHNDGNQYQSKAINIWDKDWAVIHKSVFENVTKETEERFTTLLKKYFDTGKVFEKEEGDGMYKVRRARR